MIYMNIFIYIDLIKDPNWILWTCTELKLLYILLKTEKIVKKDSELNINESLNLRDINRRSAFAFPIYRLIIFILYPKMATNCGYLGGYRRDATSTFVFTIWWSWAYFIYSSVAYSVHIPCESKKSQDRERERGFGRRPGGGKIEEKRGIFFWNM